MNTERPTPETDKAAINKHAIRANKAPECARYVPVYVCSALEQELAEAREEMNRRHKEYASALNRRVDVENTLAQVAAGKRDILTREECRELAIKLGVPPAAAPVT